MITIESPAVSLNTPTVLAGRLRKALLVLGMHRSGTSALTRVLSLLGADLPMRLMPPVANDNPRGFWEPERIARLHDEMLTAVDSSWDDVLPMPEQWHELSALRGRFQQMLDLLQEEFGESGLFVLKDPRICRLIPMWNELLEQFGAEPRHVIMLRNPLEVAGSLHARNGFPVAKSLAIWLRHVLDAEWFTRGQVRTFVRYEDLLRDWRRVTDKIAAELRLSWPRSHHQACLEVEEFLSAKDRHHEISDEEFDRNTAASPWMKKAYWALRRMEEGAVDEGTAALDAVRGELAVAEQSYGPILAAWRRQVREGREEFEQFKAKSQDAERRLGEVEPRCTELQLQLEQERRSHAETRAVDLAAAQESCRAKTAEIEELRRERSTSESQMEELTKELAVSRRQSTEASLEVDRVRKTLSSHEARLSELSGDNDRLHRTLAEREQDLTLTRSELDALRSQLWGQEQQLAARDRKVLRLEQDLDSRETELARERDQAAFLDGERSRADMALSRWTGMAIALREESQTQAGGLTQLSSAHSIRRLTRRAYLELGSRAKLLLGRRRVKERRERVLASGLFDVAYYLLHNPDVLSAGVDPLDHFLLRGGKEGRSPCALFNTIYYLRTYADVSASGINPLEHYLLFGAAEGRRPCGLFDTNYYLRENPTVLSCGLNPLSHFMRWGAEEGCKPHPLFDTKYYFRENPEVRVLRLNPLVHYLEHGCAEGRKPNPLFDTAYYLRENVDVATARLEPLQHYIEIGAAMGRNPNPLFDTAYYLQANPDVAAAGVNPLQHYLERGGCEGRIPSLAFDAAAYLHDNPDVAAEGRNPLEHYLECGVKQGRRVTAVVPRGLATIKSFALPDVKTPLVSVIVPVHNGWSTTLECLYTVHLNSGELPYEVILADDGSTDETAQAADVVGNLSVVAYHPAAGEAERLGHVSNCNQAARQAHGKYLVFLAPDMLVQSGWLESMVELSERDPTVGIVGPKILSPQGMLREAGRIVWCDASETKYGAGQDPHRPEFSHVRESDYVSGAAMLVRRSLFEQVGGFDERFSPTGLEDADLAFKCRQQECKVLYQPNAAVIQNDPRPEAANGPDALSHRLYFEHKWSRVLKAEHLPPDTHVFLARDHSRSAKHLLYCDWDVPAADRDSGSFRACNLMQILLEMGYRLTFLPANLYPAEPQVGRLRQMGIFAACGPGFESLESFFANYGGYFDAVVVSRMNVAEECMDLVRKHCRKAFRVFDTTDLHFLREQREAELSNDAALRAKAASTRTKELGFMADSDVTLVVSAVEKELLRREVPQERVEIVSNIHPVFGSARPFSERKNLLFIGGFNHRPNPDAVKWLAKDIFPRIRQRLPGVEAYIIGSNPPVDILALNSDDFHVVGYVADIEPYFNECRLSVVPLRYGAGVKGKINMSMSYGLPVVSTSVGCEGMFLNDGRDVLVADDAEAFADAVCRLYTDASLWERLSAGGLRNVEQFFSFEAARRALGEVFSSSPSSAAQPLAKAA
jgi:GT2 family glycosyltransferase